MENNNTHFEIIPALLKEMDAEATVTRKMLALIPEDKHDWQPHPKSMKLGILAVHLAELPSWVSLALHTDGMDFAAQPYIPTQFSTNAELLQIFEKAFAEGRAALAAAQEGQFTGSWVLRNGDIILANLTKYETIRHAFQQSTHHRAQLGVFLRLLDIPIPGTYGPSADEMGM